jgi:dienelactone hydrolase
MKTKLLTSMAACATLLVAAGAAHADRAERGTDVDLKAADGTPLKATYYSAGKPGPGIILLHMCNSKRTAWATLGPRLAARGMHALAIDYRGYGDSGGKRYTEWSAEERTKMTDQTWPSDIDAALAYLATRPGVDASRIGAAGGSCGVNEAIQVARRHSEVKTLVLLAGGTDTAGQDYLVRNPWLPVFGVAAHDDGDAVEHMQWILGFSSNPANRIKTYPKGGHGTDLFAVHRDLEPAIVSWFEQHLVKQPVRAAAGGPKPGPSARLAAELRAPGGTARVRQRLRESRKAGKPPSLPPEAAINLLGYELMQGGRVQDAIQLFELNVEAHPESANAHDSLADGYVAAKDRGRAQAHARKALDLLARDKNASEDFKKEIRKSAEAKLKAK